MQNYKTMVIDFHLLFNYGRKVDFNVIVDFWEDFIIKIILLLFSLIAVQKLYIINRRSCAIYKKEALLLGRHQW